MEWIARAPQMKDLTLFIERVRACFEYDFSLLERETYNWIHRAAGLATSCKVNIQMRKPYFDLNQNNVLGWLRILPLDHSLIITTAKEFASVLKQNFKYTVTNASTSASTDFVSFLFLSSEIWIDNDPGQCNARSVDLEWSLCRASNLRLMHRNPRVASILR